MRKAGLHTILSTTGLVISLAVSGCTYGPMKEPTTAGLVIYTKGAKQHTANLQIALPPTEVYAGMLRAVARHPELHIINNDQKRYLLEVLAGDLSLTGQATELDQNSTLFFIWADAGSSGQTGESLAMRAIRELCSELAIDCTMKDR